MTTNYTNAEKREALELAVKRLKFNIRFDYDTLIYRAFGLYPQPPDNSRIAEIQSMLDELKDG